MAQSQQSITLIDTCTPDQCTNVTVDEKVSIARNDDDIMTASEAAIKAEHMVPIKHMKHVNNAFLLVKSQIRSCVDSGHMFMGIRCSHLFAGLNIVRLHKAGYHFHLSRDFNQSQDTEPVDDMYICWKKNCNSIPTHWHHMSNAAIPCSNVKCHPSTFVCTSTDEDNDNLKLHIE